MRALEKWAPSLFSGWALFGQDPSQGSELSRSWCFWEHVPCLSPLSPGHASVLAEGNLPLSVLFSPTSKKFRAE